ncbi:hypothetical protein MANES_05G119167v8 [Manihot esculenta]|uniref:Uncharacterized protein n=1 Tax=Manihot esculenta TaxID=3983 RepID=A0ACB7HNL2_MANES|nr:hypothetical protein MANES_05G119167v8 [Manihot esculenta]
MGDPLSLQASDHPGMSLVSAPLLGPNFRSWSRAVRIALGAKMKLGFIEGIFSAPSKDSEGYEQWKKCDFMVTSWILNSISKELVDGFTYTAFARDLWQKISERFEECNGPMIYELLDELRSVETLPTCTCGASRAIAEITNRNRLIPDITLMQFLMGLNEAFRTVRDQVLGMDPLPTVNKAYSMNLSRPRRSEIKKGHCTFCNMDGHTREGCFKLIGYPD